MYLTWTINTQPDRSVRNWYDAPVNTTKAHDDVIKWKHFPRYSPFVRGIHRSPEIHIEKWYVINHPCCGKCSHGAWPWPSCHIPQVEPLTTFTLPVAFERNRLWFEKKKERARRNPNHTSFHWVIYRYIYMNTAQLGVENFVKQQ